MAQRLVRLARLMMASVVAIPLTAGALSIPSTSAGAASSASPTPPAAVCGSVLLRGPVAAPAGAVVVTPGGVGLDVLVRSYPGGTTFYLLAGVHTLGAAGAPGIYDQVMAKDGDVFVGAPGAVLDGQDVDHAAFTTQASRVRISYLTIQHFNQLANEGVVNHDSGDDWVIDHSTIAFNHGGAMMVGARQVVSYDCLADNGQYGVNGFQAAGGITGLVIDHSEIARNDSDDWENTHPGCGCSGGLKLWATKSSRVTNSWVHDNRNAGIWVDGTNVDVTIQSNVIEGNDGEGIIYEISYNAVISGNTLRRNAIVKGRVFAARNDNFPVGAIYISESGGDSRVSPGVPLIDIHDNLFDNNWSGVTVWENADRFCGSGELATMCTLVNPASSTATTCRDPAGGGSINVGPYYSDCRWKSQNVKVHNNTFSVDVGDAGLNCSSVFCGRQALFSNYGTYPSWSPYKATVIQQAITFDQGNVWSNNTYIGAWGFMAHDTGQSQTFAAWQGAPYYQDAGSTYTGITTPPTAGTNALDADTSGLEASIGTWSNWFSTRVTRSTLQAHSGTHSLRVDITGRYGWGAQPSNWPGFAATPGDRSISFWGKLGSGTSLGANMNVTWRNASGVVLGVSTVTAPALSSIWKQATANVVAPMGTTAAQMDMSGASGVSGNFVYLDDFTVSTNVNVLDVDTAGVEAGAGKWSNWYSAGISQSTLQAHNGAHSLKVDITAPYGWGVQLSNSPGFAVTPGSETISFWGLLGAGDNLAVDMNATWRDSSGNVLDVATVSLPALSTVWRQATANVVAPAGTTTVQIGMTSASGVAGNSLYLDDFSVASG